MFSSIKKFHFPLESNVPDRPWGPPNPMYNGYPFFPGVKGGRGVLLTPHPLLVPEPRKSRTIHLFPLWAVRPVQSLSACTRVHFTFTFTLGSNVLNIVMIYKL